MERDLKETVGIGLALYYGDSEGDHFHQDIELLYVMEGGMRLTVGEQTYVLSNDDVVIVNSNKRHAIRAAADCLYCRIHIPYQLVSDATGNRLILFWCNSVAESSDSYSELRRILRELIGDYANGRKDRYFNRYSLCYKLLHFITSAYVVSEEDLAEEQVDRKEARQTEIISYIHNNYYRALSLTELADNLYLTKSYLSRYIKKNLGMNFLDYLNNIRIHHAMDDLLHTDSPITKIAMDNGFPNVATFNRLFKEYYHEAPSVYRKKMKPDTKAEKLLSEQKERALREKLDEHFLIGKLPEKTVEASEVQRIEADARDAKAYKPTWNYVINAGPAEELLLQTMRDQIIYAKKTLNIRYIRFWDIFSDRLYMVDSKARGSAQGRAGVASVAGSVDAPRRAGAARATGNADAGGGFNFERLCSIIDFLLENGLVPFIELGEKPRRIQRTVSEFILPPQNQTVFETYEEWKLCLDALMRHFLTQYGAEEVSRWKFELWDDRRKETAAGRTSYNQWFRDTWEIIKKYFPETQLGGAGRHLGWYRQHTTDGIRQWIDAGIYPDFLTYTYFPYSAGEINSEVYSKRKTDENNLRVTLDELQDELLKFGFPPREVYITDWDGTISDRNYTNDSCWKAAWALKNYIDSVGRIDGLSYSALSDITSQHYDTLGILNGNRGIFSKDGIEKPVYHAMSMVRHLQTLLIARGDSYIVTTDGSMKIAVACHNFKPRNYLYYVQPEDRYGPMEQYSFFDEQDGRRMELHLTHVPDGLYVQKTYTYNREHGSVLDEWMKMGCRHPLQRSDVDYLKRVSVPEITVEEFEVRGGKLDREWFLQAHEIKLVHFTKAATT